MAGSDRSRPRVGIACQGGGSHTAFTAGVLDRLLAEQEVAFDVVELTGTSGGAICAFVTWFGLASEGTDEAGRAKARRLLAQVWADIAAREPADAVANALGVGVARARSMGFPVAEASPNDLPLSDWGREVLRSTLEDAVDPDDLASAVGRTAPPSPSDPLAPRLEIGAVDLQRGSFRTFTERDVTIDAVLASAAVPPLFRAAPVAQSDGTTRWYWDGLFSQNPPLGDLVGRGEGRMDRPDELWVVQINPQREDELPRTVAAIADRRNELGGNLSVNQELRFLRQLNQWHAGGELTDVYRPVEVKTINFEESRASPDRPLDYATKLDRSPEFVERLWTHGREQAERFLAVERDRRHVRETATKTWMGDETLDECVREDFVAHIPTSLAELGSYLRGEAEQEPTPLDRESYAAFVDGVRGAFSDLEFAVEEVVAESGAVALRWRASGTHSGPLGSVEPTGEPVTLSGMRVDRLDDGRLAESWTLFEQWHLLRQLDAAEPAAALSTASRVTATPVVTQLSAPTENQAVARTLVSDVWSGGDRDGLDRVLDADCVLHLDDGRDVRGREAYWAFVRRYRDAFPDLTVTVEDTVSEGDKIVLRTRVRGTHEGPFLDVDATGREFDVTRLVVHHLADGRIVETGVVEDTVRLLHQLGVRPGAVGVP